jgi:hypothetical protein
VVTMTPKGKGLFWSTTPIILIEKY